MWYTEGRGWEKEAFSDFWYMIPDYENWATYYYPLSTCCRWITQVIYLNIKLWGEDHSRDTLIKPEIV